MKTLFSIFFLTIFTLSAQSQNKEIFADTNSYYFKHRNDKSREVELPDLLQSTNDFYFRYSNFGQIVNFWKNNDSIGGTITNHIVHIYGLKYRKRETVFKIIMIDSTLLPKVYELVSDSAMWNLPTDSEIEGWVQFFDGTACCIEYANKQAYWLKSYGNPEEQRSLPEAVFFVSFKNQLDSLLQLKEGYKQFDDNLPKRGCYHYDYYNFCYQYYLPWLGYSGSARLPLGYRVSINIPKSYGIWAEHRFNTNNSYDFLAGFGKADLLIKNKNKLGDAILYEYRQRKFDGNIYQNHKAYYALYVARLRIGAGVDFLKNEKQEIGGLIDLSYNLPYKLPYIQLHASIFEQHIDYKINVEKTIRFREIDRLCNQIFIVNVFFERFQKRNDIGVGLRLYLW